jgi:hypothetical protein
MLASHFFTGVLTITMLSVAMLMVVMLPCCGFILNGQFDDLS